MVAQTRVSILGSKEGVPIIEFTKAGDIEMVQTLVQEGTSVNTLGNDGGGPLHIAVKDKQFHMVRGLLELKADINLKDRDEKTVLYQVLNEAKPDLDLARFLVSKGARKDGIPQDKLERLK